MNKRITKLFACCHNNKVVVIETNLEMFCELFKNLEPSCHSYRWFLKEFKQEPCFDYTLNGKTYTFQQLV